MLDIIFWFRILVGLAVGTIAGLLKLSGAPVIVAFGVLAYGGSYLYYSRFLEVDESDINEQELMMEGVGNSVGMFMLSWILISSFV